MKTVSYILLLAAIHGNIALIRRKELTVQNVKTVMDELIQQNKFQADTPFTGDVSCSQKSFLDCYKDIHWFYEEKLSKEIFSMFKAGLKELLEKYKLAVALLVSGKYAFDSSKFISQINLNDSLMHCPIGALSLHKNEDIKIDDLLHDYIFFSDANLLSGAKDLSNFTDTLNKHFDVAKYRDSESYTQLAANNENYLFIKSHFLELKKEIDNYSSAFCELQQDLRLAWINADTWAWKRLSKSTQLNSPSKKLSNIMDIGGLEVEFETDILNKTKYTYFHFPLDLPLNEQDPKNVDSTKSEADKKEDYASGSFSDDNSNLDSTTKGSTSTSSKDPEEVDHRVRKLRGILDWKLSDGDHGERIKNLPIPIKERKENITPLKMESLNELIKARNNDHKSISVERFYHKTSLVVDLIVVKVLFPRLLHYGIRAMIIYYENMNSPNVKDKEYRFFQQLYVGEQILIFKHALEMFFSIQQFTFDKETVIDMLRILDFLVKAYMFHIQKKNEPTDPSTSIQYIQQYLNDIRFKQDSVDASKNVQEISITNWEEAYNAVNEAVFLMIHLSEIKKQK